MLKSGLQTQGLAVIARMSLVAALAAIPLAGCQKNSGSTGGRIDPYRTTSADRLSDRASIPAMLEFGDTVAAQLAQQITDIDEIRNSPTKVVLELGSIDNHTATPSSDFEQLRNRVRGQLYQSRLMRKYFLIVENRQRMQAEYDRIVGPDGPPGGDSQPSDRGGVAGYDPRTTYVLQGDFFEMNRLDRRQYYFEFKLTNLVTREIVFSEHFDLGQQ
ncbi:MAG: hypothetical protein IT444_01440 [Phycisphaeraceae bacterium]|nr:hypothetical protein [Phycisphaeraceae bacterium]